MSLDTDKLMERRRQRRQAMLWKVVAAISITALIAVVLARTLGQDSAFSDGLSAGELLGGGRIARVNITGIIVEDRHRDKLLQELKDDDHIKAVLVEINSPGGTVVGGENLYLGLRDVATEKPVVAVMGSTATSAAYMTAIGADRIFARQGTLTGSIGVIMQTADVTQLMDKIGVKPETIKSGALKAQPNPMEPLSDDAREHVQQVVMDMYDLFVDMVAERRAMDIDATKALADGRVFTGKKALDAGLIDAIGGEAEAVAWLETEKGLEADLPVVDKKPKYPRPDVVERVFGAFGKALVSERLTLDGLLSVWHPNL
ncbi:signal peptide peptidase SppA [Magnetovibrio sp.]|uniref:signal peptide peptidase SppA n=1 Tax=Magnetovibrio sp. TaxID=2024836 RepID=UPI002F95F5DD